MSVWISATSYKKLSAKLSLNNQMSCGQVCTVPGKANKMNRLNTGKILRCSQL